MQASSVLIFIAIALSCASAFDLTGTFVVISMYDDDCTGVPVNASIQAPGDCWNIMDIASVKYTYTNGQLTEYMCNDTACGDCLAVPLPLNTCTAISNDDDNEARSSFHNLRMQMLGAVADATTYVSASIVTGFPQNIAQGKTLLATYDQPSCQGSVTQVSLSETDFCFEMCVASIGKMFCSYSDFAKTIATSSGSSSSSSSASSGSASSGSASSSSSSSSSSSGSKSGSSEYLVRKSYLGASCSAGYLTVVSVYNKAKCLATGTDSYSTYTTSGNTIDISADCDSSCKSCETEVSYTLNACHTETSGVTSFSYYLSKTMPTTWSSSPTTVVYANKQCTGDWAALLFDGTHTKATCPYTPSETDVCVLTEDASYKAYCSMPDSFKPKEGMNVIVIVVVAVVVVAVVAIIAAVVFFVVRRRRHGHHHSSNTNHSDYRPLMQGDHHHGDHH